MRGDVGSCVPREKMMSEPHHIAIVTNFSKSFIVRCAYVTKHNYTLVVVL